MTQDETRAREMVEAVYRSDSRRVLATLIRLLGDFDLAEEAMHEAFAAAVLRWPSDGVPDNPRAWLVSAGRFKAIDGIRRRARFDASLHRLVEQFDREEAGPSAGDDDDGRGRPAAAHLHLLPSGPAAGGPDRADPARSLRPHHRGDRPGVPGARAHGGAADRAGQVEDSRRPHSLPDPGPRGAVRSARRGAPGGLPGVQRGILGLRRRLGDPARPVGGGDPAGPAGGGAAAGARGDRAPGAHAAP